MCQIRVVTPASSVKRLKINAEVADGFVYCVSHFGVTGLATNSNIELGSYVKRVRKYFKLPVAVGFGISSREDVQKVEKYADIVVVGSAILKILNTQHSFDSTRDEISIFVRNLTYNCGYHK